MSLTQRPDSSEQLKERVIREVTKDKKSLKDVAKALYISDRQLLLLLKSWGVELPKRKRNLVPMPDRNTLMVMYHKEGNIQKVAEFYSVGVNTVLRWMREMNIPTRRMKMKEDEKIKFLEKHLESLRNVSF